MKLQNKHIDGLSQSIYTEAFRGEFIVAEAEFAAHECGSSESIERLL
jgi:hypothetical protein